MFELLTRLMATYPHPGADMFSSQHKLTCGAIVVACALGSGVYLPSGIAKQGTGIAGQPFNSTQISRGRQCQARRRLYH